MSFGHVAASLLTRRNVFEACEPSRTLAAGSVGKRAVTGHCSWQSSARFLSEFAEPAAYRKATGGSSLAMLLVVTRLQ